MKWEKISKIDSWNHYNVKSLSGALTLGRGKPEIIWKAIMHVNEANHHVG